MIKTYRWSLLLLLLSFTICFVGVQSSVLECYSRFNTLGSAMGNCGVSNRQYVPCTDEHVQCGQLMCDGGTFRRGDVAVSVNITIRSTTVGSNPEMCSTFSSSPTLDTVNPGLVPDGIKCGNESVSCSLFQVESVEE